jgi:2-polyprenyl-6-methoxyphenol hydroxylase-like FAD-dependent oxidoreductase
VLEFSDGSVSDEYDLIIGADGVKSVVRKAVVGDGIQDEYLPHYE